MSPLRERWALDPDVVFLNHGSFGACPRAVLEAQAELRAEMEREPVRFFTEALEPRIDAARREAAAFVGADPADLGFVRNATTGVNAVLRSLSLRPGDELLVTDHGYPACRNAVDFVAARSGARVAVARVPFPIASEDEVLERVLDAVSARTRVALLDHVTSPTGLVLPIARLCRELSARGVDVLVDGAHAPGMLDLDVAALGAAWYSANFHKWTCAPKGAGFLWVREDKQSDFHPAVISHGYASTRPRPRLHEELDWTGTDDPTPWLCVPIAIRHLEGLVEGGWPALRARNRALALWARALLCDALDVAPPAPNAMIGALGTVPLPDTQSTAGPVDPLQRALLARHRVQVPLPLWPAPPKRLLRLSAHLHNDEADYRALVEALHAELAR